MRFGWFPLLFAMAMTASLPAQTPPDGFSLTATYDREGLPVPNWKFHILPSGATDYTSHHSAVGVSDSAIHFQMSRTGMARLARLLSDSHGLVPCETKTKNLARMGDKSFAYTALGAAEVRCTFNYTDNRALAQAAEYLSNVSATLEEGSTLDRLHRYDRLGLDPEMTRLATAAKEGKAEELGAIRSSLEALVADDAVLDRVRQKAAQLLAAAKLQ